jgi:hypothetical protein
MAVLHTREDFPVTNEERVIWTVQLFASTPSVVTLLCMSLNIHHIKMCLKQTLSYSGVDFTVPSVSIMNHFWENKFNPNFV